MNATYIIVNARTEFNHGSAEKTKKDVFRNMHLTSSKQAIEEKLGWQGRSWGWEDCGGLE